jgi:hypothetical protein
LLRAVCAPLTGYAQGTFQNLGFESASIPANPGVSIPFTNAFPGWVGFLGPYQATDAGYNGISLGFAELSIIDRGSQSYSNNVIAGNYTAALSAGFAGTGFVFTAISQTGLVPASAQTLLFSASGVVSDMALTLNGQTVPFFPLATGPNYLTYGGNISMFAGQPEELRFTEQPISSPNSTVFLDSIQFSDQPVPEPTPASLLGLLGSLLLFRRLAISRHWS